MTWLWNRTKSLSGSLLRTRSCRTVKFYFGPFMFLSMAKISVPIKKRKILKRGPSATLSTHLIKQHINHGLFILLKQSEKLLKAVKYIPIEYYFLRPLNVYLLYPFFPFLQYHWDNVLFPQHKWEVDVQIGCEWPRLTKIWNQKLGLSADWIPWPGLFILQEAV